jgi:DNA-binding winged helix-turn-helix (wHTH) protein
MRVHFGEWTVDLDARRLTRGPNPVHLSPKAFDTLKTLVEKRPRAVSKAEILESVWPGVFVSEASLTRVINEIRAALEDIARDGRVIRTIHSYGYSFVAAVEQDPPATDSSSSLPRGVCLLVSATRTLILRQGEQLVGRDPGSAVWIDSPKVSWRHARIVASQGGATIEDLGSKNGTFVGDTRIEARVALRHGDEVRIGRVRFVFRLEAARQATETDASRDP